MVSFNSVDGAAKKSPLNLRRMDFSLDWLAYFVYAISIYIHASNRRSLPQDNARCDYLLPSVILPKAAANPIMIIPIDKAADNVGQTERHLSQNRLIP